MSSTVTGQAGYAPEGAAAGGSAGQGVYPGGGAVSPGEVAQRESAEAYIASQRHAGWHALRTDYSDGGFTGGNMERPGLQRLLADIEAGRVDCVVVYKVDRLSRSLMDFAQLIGLFEQHNVAFVSVTQHFDTSTSMGRLVLNILLSFAQFEREIIGERIRDKKLATAKQGKYVGGQPFLGYDIDRERKRLIVNPAEAELVRQIFESFVQHKSPLRVAKAVNAQGHRTKEYRAMRSGKVVGGQSWNVMSVYRVLTNRKYLGEMTHKGKAYPGEHEAILDRRLWDQVHRIMDDNERLRMRPGGYRIPAFLKGLLRCGHCGTMMGASQTKRRGKQYRYYVCNHAERHGRDSCPIKCVAAGTIEAAVKDRIRAVLASPDMIARTFREVQTQVGQRRVELGAQRERLEARLAELKKAIGRLAKNGDDGAVAAELQKLNDEFAHVQHDLDETNRLADGLAAHGPDEDDVRAALQSIDPLWNELFPVEQERIVRLLVQDVAVGRTGLHIRMRLNGLKSLVGELRGDGRAEVAEDGQTVDIHVPMEFRVRSGRKEIVLPDGATGEPAAKQNRPLVLALAKAFKWQAMLDAGEVKSLEDLAAKMGVDRLRPGDELPLDQTVSFVAVCQHLEPRPRADYVVGQGQHDPAGIAVVGDLVAGAVAERAADLAVGCGVGRQCVGVGPVPAVVGVGLR